MTGRIAAFVLGVEAQVGGRLDLPSCQAGHVLARGHPSPGRHLHRQGRRRHRRRHISVMRTGRAVKVRLHGIDCPEGHQDFGRRAKQFTSGLVFGKTLRVDVRDTDRYGRLVGRVFVGGTDVNLEIVRAGFAWDYKRYSDDPALARAEREARAARRHPKHEEQRGRSTVGGTGGAE
jgi:endonuclease YncB( thermonuclease family)